MELIKDLRKAKRGAIAKAITIMENDPKESRKLIKEIFPKSGKSIIIGITGPAGAGKSSIIDKTSLELRKLGSNPAVLAVDPTSHITGGAILGDRVRMTESTDSGTYIRSIASRGAIGAVSLSLRNAIRILEFAGFDPIIIESVGAGQTEVEISNIVDLTVVMFNPHTGDTIQTIKAGITEIGDIYVVNKSDLDGTTQLFQAVQEYIGDSEEHPPILKTSVKKNKGIKEFAQKLKEMSEQKLGEKSQNNATRLEIELQEIVLNNVKNEITTMLNESKSYSNYLKKVQTKKIDPYNAADKITKSILK